MRSFVKKSGGGGKNPQVDITPLLDIVFQLLLFFILTSAMLQPTLELELPQSNQQEESVEADLIVSIDREDRLFLNDAPASREEAAQSLRALAAEKPDAIVILRGDGGLSYGKFFELLDLARNAGIKTLNLAYEPEEE
ncbi:MAG: biopolymer transporter ExbD [Spirochaetaceae bacterium]|jgi:biopolymer transport protein ExbD|nr:biopolymer transporter ExbD [Spirochaetaceae bacterium]